MALIHCIYASAAAASCSDADIQAIVRASQARNGRPRPAIIEVPNDVMEEDFTGDLRYTPVLSTRSGPDPVDVPKVAEALVNAKRLVLYAGQGVHYAKAWPQLKELAELLAAPVTTTYAGSPKAADAMLNMATSYAELKDLARAKKTLQQLVSKFPGTPAAQSAKDRLAVLK